MRYQQRSKKSTLGAPQVGRQSDLLRAMPRTVDQRYVWERLDRLAIIYWKGVT